MDEVLVIGESIVDVIAGVAIPGGSAANVALGLARLEVPVRFETYVADDRDGLDLIERLRATGVAVSPRSFAAATTSRAVARVDAHGDVTYEFDVSWETPAVEPSARQRVLHLGSFPVFLGTRDDLERLVERWDDRGHITFDPNVREALFPEPAEARRRVLDLAPRLTVLKLSDEDLGWLFPGRQQDSAVDRLLDCGVRLVVVTAGSRGMRLVSRDADVAVTPPRVIVSDTVGAGDTVMTALIADLVRRGPRYATGQDLLELGEVAARAAAITVSRAGADLPWAHEVRALT